MGSVSEQLAANRRAASISRRVGRSRQPLPPPASPYAGSTHHSRTPDKYPRTTETNGRVSALQARRGTRSSRSPAVVAGHSYRDGAEGQAMFQGMVVEVDVLQGPRARIPPGALAQVQDVLDDAHVRSAGLFGRPSELFFRGVLGFLAGL